MKAKSMHKEILLVRTGFSSRQFCETSNRLNYKNYLKEKEKFVLAWDRLLLDMFPEISELHSVNKKLYLCKVSERILLLELKAGEIHLDLEMYYSIDPDSSMSMQILS